MHAGLQTPCVESTLDFLPTFPPLLLSEQTLSKATPSEIPPIMPHLLNCIRMVWNISRFYNTPERLTGLLRKVSNEIISRCCAVINLDDIFGGDIAKVRACPALAMHSKQGRRLNGRPSETAIDLPVLAYPPAQVMVTLKESINAGEQWKKVYTDVALAVSAKSAKPWDFDSSSIFAHIDAFVQVPAPPSSQACACAWSEPHSLRSHAAVLVFAKQSPCGKTGSRQQGPGSPCLLLAGPVTE